MRKKYILLGLLSYRLLLKDGTHYISCMFENGSVSGLGTRAASYITDDENVQQLIESCEEFKKGYIKLDEVEYIDEPKKDEILENVFPDVTNIQSARAVLLGMGVALNELQNKTAILEYAEKKGIVFPNYK